MLPSTISSSSESKSRTFLGPARRGRLCAKSSSSLSTPDEVAVDGMLLCRGRVEIMTSGIRPEGFGVAFLCGDVSSFFSGKSFCAASRYDFPFNRFVGTNACTAACSSSYWESEYQHRQEFNSQTTAPSFPDLFHDRS